LQQKAWPFLITFRGEDEKREKGCGCCTVGFLRYLALFGEREEDLLCGCFGDGAFEVGRDVYGAVWAVYLMGNAGEENEE
jgi:hypothetical protein